jgi:hypothetical protein
MSTDFAALTAAVAALPDVRVCLLVSRDGLALASHPPDEEDRALATWNRLSELGDVERGFIVVGSEQWVFCHRGPYAALAVARSTSRAGVVLDRLEQMLLVVEEARLHRAGTQQTGGSPGMPEQTRGLRTLLHPEPRPVEPRAIPEPRPVPVPVPVVAATREVRVSALPVDPPRRPLIVPEPRAPEPTPPPPIVPEPAEPEPTPPEPAPPPPPEPIVPEPIVPEPIVPEETPDTESTWPGAPAKEEGEVDKIALSREFAGLFAPQEESE